MIYMSLNSGPKTTMEPSPKETVRNAAVLYNGKIFEGTTHGHALGVLLKAIKIEDPDLYKKVKGDEYELVSELEHLAGDPVDFEGFVTSTGRYVTRAEATNIAAGARQLNKTKEPGSDLYSENLKG